MAEHSVHCHDEAVRRDLPPDWRMLVLLHDAHEAYLGDIVTPAVNALDVIVEETRGIHADRLVTRALKELRRRNDWAIFAYMGLLLEGFPGAAHFVLKGIDASAMMTERDALAPVQPEPWGRYETTPRLPFTPQCWDAHTARREFLERVALYDVRALKTLADLDLGFAA